MRDNHRQVDDLLSPFVGHQIDGGCDTCDAYQTVEQIDSGSWIIHVSHDDRCPVLARHQEADRRNGRRP